MPNRLQAINTHLNNDGVVIMFPAGEVFRFSPKGVRDGKWHNSVDGEE